METIHKVCYFRLHLLVNSNFVNQKSSSSIDGIEDHSEMMKKMFGPKYDELNAQKTRRFIKTHLPFNLMPHNIKDVGAKVIYVARNPNDVVVSYYHFHKVNPGYQFTKDFESFLQYYMDNLGKEPIKSNVNPLIL